MIIYSTRYYYAALTAGVMIAILGAIGVLGLNMPSAMNAVWFGYLFATLTTLGLNADYLLRAHQRGLKVNFWRWGNQYAACLGVASAAVFWLSEVAK